MSVCILKNVDSPISQQQINGVAYKQLPALAGLMLVY